MKIVFPIDARLQNPTINTTMTKQEILSKYAQDRTRCTVYTRVMGYHRPV